jgi:solute carrier family 25, member 33/36
MSYLGGTESTIQWVLYERLKRLMASMQGAGVLASAGTATGKCIASLIIYPHEVRHPLQPLFFVDVGFDILLLLLQVLRTRLQQPLVNGTKKYTGRSALHVTLSIVSRGTIWLVFPTPRMR